MIKTILLVNVSKRKKKMNEKEMNQEARKKIVNRDYDIKNPQNRRKDAIANLTILLGEFYDGTDFSPFNQVLSTVKFSKCDNAMDYLREFWRYFWPYLNRLIVDWEQVCKAYDQSLEEQDLVLKKYADVMHEKKLMEVCLKERDVDFKEWKKNFERLN